MSTKRSYRQYCGLAAALDVVGERWALLVVRELEPGPRRFTDLFEGLPGVSTDVLTERLRQLEAAGAVKRTAVRHPAPAKLYELTPRGRELAGIAASLARWGASLLPATPGRTMNVRARWALQSMVHAYVGGLEEGAYQWTIDDDTFTLVISDSDDARLLYGPSPTPPRLALRCGSADFLEAAASTSSEKIVIDEGTGGDLLAILQALPLEVGASQER